MNNTFIRTCFFIFFTLVLFACGSSPQVETEHVTVPPVDSAKGVVAARLGICTFLEEISISNIDQYIHPGKGLWIIQSAGAMPHMEHTSQVDKNFPVDFTSAKMEALPTVNCESKSFWTKEGCYVQELSTFKAEKIWTYCGLGKEDEARVEETAGTISVTVINTTYSARYYFSRIEDKWYLTVVDLRKPCEA